MHARFLNSLIKSENAAVAPTVALSLFGLIAVGGIAFDYARLAAMDSELQAAADQAALAAATQLDQKSDAITRSTDAANNLIQNNSRFASDRSTLTATLNFYDTYNQSSDSGHGTTDATAARFVEVTLSSRQANYSLTPVVALFNSGNIQAHAIAGMGSAVCNVPPLMLCAPNADFPTASDIGKGVKLQPGPQTGAWAPGDYGYLDFGNGASGVSTNLGGNQTIAGCYDNSGNLQTEPGNKASVTSALNTRFDIYEAGTGTCDPSTGNYCPAENTRKDFVKTEVVEFKNVTGSTVPTNPGCGAAGATVTDFTQNSLAKGFPRDTCHINGSCTSNFGNGTWDVAGYFAANHPTDAVPTGASATRYAVYKWELADKTNRMQSQWLNPSGPPATKTTGPASNPKTDYTYTNYCAYSQPVNGTAVVASTTQKDRRVMQVASVDCDGLNGKSPVKVLKWLDVFLVEPSWDRTTPYSTGKSEIYGEIIGVATKPDGSNAFQYFSRNQPYLIK